MLEVRKGDRHPKTYCLLRRSIIYLLAVRDKERGKDPQTFQAKK